MFWLGVGVGIALTLFIMLMLSLGKIADRRNDEPHPPTGRE